jgi:hypothetical protein
MIVLLAIADVYLGIRNVSKQTCVIFGSLRQSIFSIRRYLFLM